MARLHFDSDEEFPEISAIMNGSKSTKSSRPTSAASDTSEATITNPPPPASRAKSPSKRSSHTQTASDALERPPVNVRNRSQPELELLSGRKKLYQRPLKAANDHDLLRPLAIPEPENGSRWDLDELAKPLLEARAARTTRQRRAKAAVTYKPSQEPLLLAKDEHDSAEESLESRSEVEESDGMSDFVVDGDEEVEEDMYDSSTPSSPIEPPRRKPAARKDRGNTSRNIPSKLKTPSKSSDGDWHSREDRYAASSVENDPRAILKYSPNHKPTTVMRSTEEFTTPPSSPSKSPVKLGSPSKHSHIPPTPHRPSTDAFWSQEFINDWNEVYSPRKNPEPSPPKSAASPQKSPMKRSRKELEERKAFHMRKGALAVSFLKELDDTVAGSQVQALAASSGGVKIIWSKKLNTTAGRAHWRKEIIRPKHSGSNPDEPKPASTVRHIASIEFAEKVIDDEDRLLNVLAHEYCHLANFMISGVKDNPHGKEFKKWAAKCSRAFHHRGINVTTKHAYAIDYKYIWECTKCSIEFKRHSKSIDPARHTCGACKSKLIQTRPAPRNAPPSQYQLFVKERYKAIKDANPQSPQKDIMGLIGAEYKARQKTALASSNVDDRSSREGSASGLTAVDVDPMEAVARRLDFLNLQDL